MTLPIFTLSWPIFPRFNCIFLHVRIKYFSIDTFPLFLFFAFFSVSIILPPSHRRKGGKSLFLLFHPYVNNFWRKKNRSLVRYVCTNERGKDYGFLLHTLLHIIMIINEKIHFSILIGIVRVLFRRRKKNFFYEGTFERDLFFKKVFSFCFIAKLKFFLDKI